MSEEKTVSRRKKSETASADKPAVKKTKTTAAAKAAKNPAGPKALTKAAPKKTPAETPAQAAAKGKPAARPASRAKTGAALKGKAEPGARAAAKKAVKPTGSELAELVAAAAAEHKPIDPVLLDLSGRSSVADWFFVASADNPRQMEAIAEKIIRRARERGVRPLGLEGLGRGAACPWVLVDLGEVVVHIFNLEARRLYDLEGLWTDAPRRPVES